MHSIPHLQKKRLRESKKRREALGTLSDVGKGERKSKEPFQRRSQGKRAERQRTISEAHKRGGRRKDKRC